MYICSLKPHTLHSQDTTNKWCNLPGRPNKRPHTPHPLLTQPVLQTETPTCKRNRDTSAARPCSKSLYKSFLLFGKLSGLSPPIGATHTYNTISAKEPYTCTKEHRSSTIQEPCISHADVQYCFRQRELYLR